MRRTYKAILNGDHLDWQGERPQATKPTTVEVTVDEPPVSEPNGAALAAMVRSRGPVNAFSQIKDPAAWQRAIRQDRPLPGRES